MWEVSTETKLHNKRTTRTSDRRAAPFAAPGCVCRCEDDVAADYDQSASTPYIFILFSIFEEFYCFSYIKCLPWYWVAEGGVVADDDDQRGRTRRQCDIGTTVQGIQFLKCTVLQESQ